MKHDRVLAGLSFLAVVITLMIVGTILNMEYMDVGRAPIYVPRIDLRDPEPEPVIIQARLSHYWPALGGPNCFRFVNGECLSPTASGIPWQEVVGWGCACPVEYAFGTEFTLPGGEVFVCVDRGGAIVVENGIAWLDLLVETAPVPFGTIVDVEVLSG